VAVARPGARWRSAVLLGVTAWLAATVAGHAGPPAAEIERALADIAAAEAETREAAVATLGQSGDARWLAFLVALRDGHVYVWKRPGRAEVVVGGKRIPHGSLETVEIATAYDRRPLGAAPVAELTEVAADRRLRLAIKPFLDADETRRQLADSDPGIRRAAASKLGKGGEAGAVGLLADALAREQDRRVRQALAEALATIRLVNGRPVERVAAAITLGELAAANAVPALQRLAADSGVSAEERAAATGALRRIERWGMLIAAVETAFQGLSLASILLLMALGLAIVFGLMGVINMAHGELMALGAYATFSVQNAFRAWWPESFDAYFLVAIPVSFGVAATVGILLERGLVRFLYGRPLETLLLTWGASLVIQQGLRLWFGAANVDVSAPRWLSGGAPVLTGIELPYNRVFIIALAAVSVLATYALLFRTDAGLRIRAVMQNRAMSASLGVRVARVDAATFALGAGLAGLAGCALTQIGNVGPSLGQNYIVDSFMVVVTGGVGKIAGTVLAAAGIGGLNKGIEPLLGAVFAKVAILVLVMLFLQRRPAGLFAMRGRHAEG
jgi:urea transport system permease protein